jgi:hypothetical protein
MANFWESDPIVKKDEKEKPFWANDEVVKGEKEAKKEIPPEVNAGFSVGDTLRALGSGVVGAGKSLTDVFGADNFASEALGDVQKSIQAGYSPERAAEMARRQAIEKQASESDSLTQEIGAFLGGVAEAPLQSLAQGLGSIVPYIGTGVVGAIAKLGRPALLALNTVVGTAQGAGTIKGSIYDNVKDELIKSGMDEAEAKAKAKEAQSYLGENFLDIAAGAGLGAAAARFGVESLVGRKIAGETAEEIGKKGFARRVGEAAIAEAPMEGVQAGQEQLASNLALQRQGFDVDTFAGVAGSAARDALIGGMTAGTIGALPSRTAPTGPTREETKEILRKDLESTGQTFTEEQLDAATDKVMETRKQASEERTKDESSGLDTRDSEQGVPGAGESGVVPGATEGTAASTAADVGGDRTAADTTDVGERKESATLEPTAEEDIAKQKSLIRRRKDAERAVRRAQTSEETTKAKARLQKVDAEWEAFNKEAGPRADKRVQEILGRSEETTKKDSTYEIADINGYKQIPAAEATQEVTGFKTAKGSTYEVDAEGKTSRTKKSEGKGQGTTYAPHSALYLDTAAQENMMDDMRGGMGDTAIRLGYEQDGNFVSVADINEIPEGATPKVAVVNKAENKVVSVYDAQTKPAVGLHPVEKMYTEDGMSNTHVGNKITEVTQAKAPEAVTPPVAEETDTSALSDYYNGLVDAMNRTPVAKSITAAPVLESLKANGLITEDGNGRLTMTPKGANLANDIRNATKFGERLSPEQQTELFAKYIPELGKKEAKETVVKANQLNAPSLGTSFMDWFGNSKVVDANGRPLVVYHGTLSDFTQFKLSKEGSLGTGIYFTPQTPFANSYAGMPTPAEIAAMEAEGVMSKTQIDQLKAAATGDVAPGQVGGNVIPAYVRIDKPLIIRTVDRGVDPAVDLLVALGVDKNKAEAIVEKASEDKGGITKEVMARAQKQGYDGIFQYKDGELSEVVAFSPYQIKFALQVQNTSPKKDSLNANDQLFATAHPQVVQGIKNNDVQATLRGIRDTGGKFLSAFATRMLGLNLTTRLTFDEHYDLVLEEAEKVKEQRNRIDRKSVV